VAAASGAVRWLKRLGFGVGAVLVLVGGATGLSSEGFKTFGGKNAGDRWQRAQKSPHFKDGKFQNTEATGVVKAGDMVPMMRDYFLGKEMRVPNCPLPVATDGWKTLAAPPETGLRLTWMGHATTLIEVDGAAVLTDPMWSERASPSTWVGPKRFHAPPIALERLPKLDAVVVSHEHFDHLDMASVIALAMTGVVFHVPLGIGTHLEAWGVPAAQIKELDWWEEVQLANGVRLVATPSRHFNGRGMPWRPGASWTSWSVVGPKHRVYFSGDTGMSQHFPEIAEKVGPFDVALLEIGQSNKLWADIHLGPLGAVEAAQKLKAKRLMGIHWATFELAYHPWNEPPETMTLEAQEVGLETVSPRLGEPVEPEKGELGGPWWRALPPIAARCPN
jgi:L-ascorbate metabolism protein UlaG (beta-lactamase superfamily)